MGLHQSGQNAQLGDHVFRGTFSQLFRKTSARSKNTNVRLWRGKKGQKIFHFSLKMHRVCPTLSGVEWCQSLWCWKKKWVHTKYLKRKRDGFYQRMYIFWISLRKYFFSKYFYFVLMIWQLLQHSVVLTKTCVLGRDLLINISLIGSIYSECPYV